MKCLPINLIRKTENVYEQSESTFIERQNEICTKVIPCSRMGRNYVKIYNYIQINLYI